MTDPEGIPPNHIERVKIEHIKGAVEVEILAADVNEMAGPCGAGKTSILDAICMALGGASTHDKVPITIGEDQGVVEVDTRDFMVVRMFHIKPCPGEGHGVYNVDTGKMDQTKEDPDCAKCGGEGTVERTTLKVSGKAGGRFGQRDLDKLLGSLTFDPTEFITWTGAKREKVLRQLAGQEWSESLDAIGQDLTGARSQRLATRGFIDNFNLGEEPAKVEPADLGALTDGLKLAMNCEAAVAAWNALNIEDRREPAKVEPVDLGALYSEREAAVEHNHHAGWVAAERDNLEGQILNGETEVQRLKTALADAEAVVEAHRVDLADLENPEPLVSIAPITERIEAAAQAGKDAKVWQDWADKRAGLAQAREDAFKRLPDGTTKETAEEFTVQAAQAALDEAEGAAEGAMVRAAWEERQGKLRDLEQTWERLAGDIKGHEQARDEHMKSASFPVDGLDLGDKGLTVDGIPFEQLNHGKQIDAAVSIGIALNPGLRIMFIQHGESMDQAMFDQVAARAKEAGIQLWIATVDSKGEGHGSAIHISEGRRADVEPA